MTIPMFASLSGFTPNKEGCHKRENRIERTKTCLRFMVSANRL